MAATSEGQPVASRRSAPVRILHVVGGMTRGGAETLIMNLYRHLHRDQVQFDFAVHMDQAGHFDAEIEALGGRLFAHPPPGRAGMRAYHRALTHTLDEAGPFAGVHSHLYWFNGYVMCMANRAQIPVRIAHSHNTQDGRPNTLPRRAYRWTMRRLILRHATHMFGCGRAACEALYGARCWTDTRVRAVPSAFDLTTWTAPAEERKAGRAGLGLPADVPLIGHVGRFSAQKNHRFLITIFASLLQAAPSAHLVLVGDGPLRPEIEALARAMEIGAQIHCLGIRADVAQIMRELDLLVLPSLFEGLPAALIEAQAAGVACVVSDAISAEADIGLGLVQFVSLKAETGVWVSAIMKGLGIARPGGQERQRALQTAGYDIEGMSRFMEQIYTGRIL